MTNQKKQRNANFNSVANFGRVKESIGLYFSWEVSHGAAWSELQNYKFIPCKHVPRYHSFP